MESTGLCFGLRCSLTTFQAALDRTFVQRRAEVVAVDGKRSLVEQRKDAPLDLRRHHVRLDVADRRPPYLPANLQVWRFCKTGCATAAAHGRGVSTTRC